MQKFRNLISTGIISDDMQTINDNFNSIRSDFSGSVFPTENVVVGQTFYNTSDNTEYRCTAIDPQVLWAKKNDASSQIATHNSNASAHEALMTAHNADLTAHSALFAALTMGTGLHRKVYTYNGTFTVPTGITKVYVSGCGGGGGGSSMMGLGGGGAASVFQRQIAVTPGKSYAVTIGTGGIGDKSTGKQKGSSIANLSGGDGTATSFGSFLSLTGGHGGKFISASERTSYKYFIGLAGGTGGTNGMQCVSFLPINTTWNDVSAWNGGAGGSSMFGTGGTGGMYYFTSPYTSYVIGSDGIGFGSGGGGGGWFYNSIEAYYCAGGSGAGGILIIEWEA